MMAALFVLFMMILLGTSAFGGRFFWRKYIPYCYAALIAVLVGVSAYYSYLQYFVWKHDPAIGMFFLPPYQSLQYYLQYVFFRYWSHALLAILFSLILLGAALFFNRRHGGRYFWPEEPYFIAIAILAVGYPGWLIYFPLMLVVPAFYAAAHSLFTGRIERVSYYFFWLSLAIVSIFLATWLSKFPFWGKLVV